MENLNLPSFAPRLKKNNQQLYIYDEVRKKYVLLTPEEWVRQHFINFLVSQQYPTNLMSVEKSHQTNQLQKRTDIIVHQRNLQPFLLVECKATHIRIDAKVLEQTFTYNLTIQAPYLALTNGLVHHYFAYEHGLYKELKDLPNYE